MSPQIFISHAESDKEIALRLYEDLAEAGLSPWMAEKDLLPGQNRQNAIRKTIRESQCFLALLSEDSISKRGQVQREFKIAKDFQDEHPADGIFIIPVRVEDCEATDPDMLPLTAVDLFPSYETALKRLMMTLQPDTDHLPQKGRGESPSPSDKQAHSSVGNAKVNGVAVQPDSVTRENPKPMPETPNTPIHLSIPQRKKLKKIIEQHPLVRSDHVKDREELLKSCGVWAIRNAMDCKAEAYYFASRLISELDDSKNGDGTKLFETFLPLFRENYEDQLPPDDRTFIANFLGPSREDQLPMENKEVAENGSIQPTPSPPDSKPPNPNPDNAVNFLMNFIREAINAVPAVKWAMGVGGVAAVFALISMPVFGLQPKAAFIGVSVMFIFMGVLVIFARAANFSEELRTPARVFTWFILGLFMISTSLLLTSAFFGWPRELSQIFV